MLSTILVRGCLTMYTLCVCGKVSPAARDLAILLLLSGYRHKHSRLGM